MIIMTSSFKKSSVFKMFTVHTKTESRRFRIPPDGRTVEVNPKSRAAFSNFSSVVWMLATNLQ